MKLIDLFEQQVVIKGNVVIPNETTTLVGYKHQGISIAQAKILGDFDCYQTKIKSLKQGPSWVGHDFNCGYTNITSLKQGPSWVGRNFNCYHTKITSLEQGPSWVGHDFNCFDTHIRSLHNIHKKIKHIGRRLFISNTVKSHIVGVMFIKGLQKIIFDAEQKQVENIINKHLAGNRNVHDAQEELIEAGLAEFAKL